jgi:hypothetical protein
MEDRVGELVRAATSAATSVARAASEFLFKISGSLGVSDMGFVAFLVGIASLAVLYLAGRLFLRQSVYRDYEGRAPVVHLFSAVFSLCSFMLEILMMEILGVLEPG